MPEADGGGWGSAPPPAALGPDPWTARNPKGMRAFALIWLVYLVYPVGAMLAPHVPALQRAGGLAGLALFVGLYVASWSAPTWRDARLPWMLGVAFLLSVALTAWLGVDFAGLFIFVVPLATRLPSFPLAIVTVILDTAASVVADILLHAGPSTTLTLSGICGMTGLSMLGLRRLMSTAGDLRDAREEIARLATVDERLRIARDMHDLLGHSLAVIALKAELAGRVLETDSGRAAAEIADVQAVARRALADVRTTVAGYRRLRLDEELSRARAGLEAAGIHCAFTQSAGTLPEGADAALGWVVREAATNILKHSAARTCQIWVTRQPGRAEVVVEDDGSGPPEPGGSRPAGSGLAGLAERVRGTGGGLETGRARLGGFRLRAWVADTAPERTGAAMPLGVSEGADA